MFFDDFTHRIKKNDAPNIVLFFGESESIMTEGFQTLKKKFQRQYPNGEIISFDAKSRFKENNKADILDARAQDGSDDLDEVLAAAQTTGLFSNDQLIVLKHAEKVLGGRSEKAVSQLKKYFEDQNSHSHLVFLAAGLRKSAKVVDVLEKHGWVVQCSDIPEWKIGSWIRSQAYDNGLDLTEECAQILVEKVGIDVSCLHRALEQLKAFIYPKKTVTAIEARDLPVPGIEPEIFAFLDAFGMRKTRESLLCLNRMEDKTDSGILFLLYQRIRELLRIAVEQSRGVDQSQLAEKLRIHPFRIKQLCNQSKLFSVAELKSALLDLVRFQAGIVTGRIGGGLSGVIMQKWIIKCCQKRPARSENFS